METQITPTLRYHVPKNQCYAGSRGGSRGNVHIYCGAVNLGRIKRSAHQPLCGKRAWWDRELNGETDLCPRCVEIAERHGIDIPIPTAR